MNVGVPVGGVPQGTCRRCGGEGSYRSRSLEIYLEGYISALGSCLARLFPGQMGCEQPHPRVPTATDWSILPHHPYHDGLKPSEVTSQASLSSLD